MWTKVFLTPFWIKPHCGLNFLGYCHQWEHLYRLGNPKIFVIGSAIISRYWAIQPGMRPSANNGVNIDGPKPIAR